MVEEAARTKTGRRRKNLLLLGFSSLFGVVLVAAFLAVDFYRANARLLVRHTALDQLHELDDRLGWRLKPGSSCRHVREGEFDVTYTVDAEGFRATPPAQDPAFTLTFYGDSYTFGHGVNDEETYASVIAAEYLSENVTVRNAGLEGYGIVQMYQWLLDNLDGTRPGDVVVFAPTAADIQRNVKDFVFPYTCAFRRGENQAPIEHYPVYANGQVAPIRLERTLSNKLRLLALLAPGTRGLWQMLHGRSKPDTTQEAREMVQHARREVERRGGRFVLIFLPQIAECRKAAYQVDIAAFDYHDIMDHFPTEREALYRLRFERDNHWNAAGHRLAAQAIAQTLVAEGCIDKSYLRPGAVLGAGAG